MLTKKQQIKLILLTQDKKFGQLLADAIETWKIATPVRFNSGIDFDTYKFSNETDPRCCLLGAAAANKQPAVSLTEFLRRDYKSEFNAVSFMEGFDSRLDQFENLSDAAKFAIKVRKIVFNE